MLEPIARLGFARVLFCITAVAGAAIVWLAPFPPMVDLPQHAGQVALLKDLLLGKSPWAPEVRVNLLTPYLLGYGLALPLSFVMPAAAALKLLLTVGYLLFVVACILLRRYLRGDARLDWLFLPSYFGFSWKWGLFTFLLAAPFGLLFVLIALSYGDRPNQRVGVFLLAAGVALFFAHGLVFAMAFAIGGAVLLLQQRQPRRLIRSGWPYLALGLIAVTCGVIARTSQARTPIARALQWHTNWRAIAGNFLVAPWGTSEDVHFAPLTMLVVATPWLLRSTPRWRDSRATVPFALVCIILLAAPHSVMRTALVQQRYALFLLPFFALLFRPPQEGLETPLGRYRSVAGQAILCLSCWVFWGVIAQRQLAFAAESRDFEIVMEELEPGQRALSLIFDRSSRAANSNVAYLHYPVRYQAEKGGFVEFNFASLMSPLVRYRADHQPPATFGLGWAPWSFRWDAFDAGRYRYFILRHAGKVPEFFLDGNRDALRVVKSSGPWIAFEYTGSRQEPPPVARGEPSLR